MSDRAKDLIRVMMNHWGTVGYGTHVVNVLEELAREIDALAAHVNPLFFPDKEEFPLVSRNSKGDWNILYDSGLLKRRKGRFFTSTDGSTWTLIPLVDSVTWSSKPIPVHSSMVYRVVKGDSLSSIARRFNVKNDETRGVVAFPAWERIAKINRVRDANEIYPGELLIIPLD